MAKRDVSGNGVLDVTTTARSRKRIRAERLPTAAPVPAPALVPISAPVASSRAAQMRRMISVGLGCGIPCLSLALSSIGGRLLSAGHDGLGWAFLGLCCSVLCVSLSHLAWAVRDITGAARWQSWALAVAVDVALVAGELATVAGFESMTVVGVMIGVTAVSAVLNVWAFLRSE